MRQNFQNPGIVAAFAAALLFGAGTPLSKLLLGQINPWMLAALLYLGSGLGLLVLRLLRRRARVQLAAGEWRWLAGAILAGGVAAPILLMWGLTRMPASGASLLLNAEGVFTAVIAWLVFKGHANGCGRCAAELAAKRGSCFCWLMGRCLVRRMACAGHCAGLSVLGYRQQLHA